MQEFTSAKTSINSTKVPVIFRKLPWVKAGKGLNRPYRNVDIGGGRYDTATEYLKRFNIQNLIFDPYNRSESHNITVIGSVSIEPADSATLSNVLCVIKERGKRIEALQRAKRWAKVTFISVYEGDKSGIGKATTKGWQENRRLADYIPEVQEVFKNVEIRNGVIIAH